MKMQEKISLFVGGLGGLVVSYFTSLPTVMKVLLLFMFIDYILGVIGGFVNKNLSSKIMFKGGLKKGITLIVIIVAHYLTVITGVDILLEMVIMYYVAMEVLSIFEHAIKADIPLPKVLLKFADRLKEVNEDGDLL